MISVRALWPGFAPINFNLHSSISISTPHAYLAHNIRHSSFPGGLPFLPPNLSDCLPNSILIHHKLASIANLVDITNRAKRHWNVISPTLQSWNIPQFEECLQLLCDVDELYIAASVGLCKMGDVADDIETMFDWYNSNCLVRLLFWFFLLSFLNHLPFSLVLP